MSAEHVSTPSVAPVDQTPGRAARRPVLTFLCAALGLGLLMLTVPVVLGVETAPFLMGMVFLGLVAPALVISRRADGPGAVRRMLGRAFNWHFSPGQWAIALFAVPVLTLGLAGVTGTLVAPEGGWLWMAGSYLLATVITGALVFNIWEELGWAGFLQTRLTARHGLLVGALLTAVPFAVIHIPLYFEGDPSWGEVGSNLALLFVIAPFYRYLIGMQVLNAGGSILAAGILHASWNASGNLSAVDGDWQVLVGVVLVTLAMAAHRHLAGRSHLTGREAERAVARSWIAPTDDSERAS